MDQVIILAAGKGTRMHSDVPKVLTPVAEAPLIKRLLTSVTQVCPRPTVVVGHQADTVRATLGEHYHYVTQTEPLGTGHAVLSCRAELIAQPLEAVVVLPGDHPLLTANTLRELIANHHQTSATLTLVTLRVPDFVGSRSVFSRYGRIVQNTQGGVARIVEFKDATPLEQAGTEVNVGYYCFNPAWLWQNITRLGKSNAAGEYYLTDLVGLAVTQGERVVTYTITDTREAMGINTAENLAEVEAVLASEEARL